MCVEHSPISSSTSTAPFAFYELVGVGDARSAVGHVALYDYVLEAGELWRSEVLLGERLCVAEPGLDDLLGILCSVAVVRNVEMLMELKERRAHYRAQRTRSAPFRCITLCRPLLCGLHVVRSCFTCRASRIIPACSATTSSYRCDERLPEGQRVGNTELKND